MPNPPTALAQAGQHGPPQTATEVVRQMQPEIRKALPNGMNVERVARIAMTLIKQDRNLAQSSPASFAGALLTAAALGLEPGLNNEAHLVAYNGECTLIIGYGGMAKLFWQHPLAAHLDSQAVHERDTFDFEYGLEPRLSHQPARGDRGAVTHYYAVAGLKNGAKVFTVLTADEAKKLRGGKVGPDARFKSGDPMHWMERKTAIRQLFKLLPKTTEFQQAAEVEDKTGTELHAELIERKEIEASLPAIERGHDPEPGEILEVEPDPNPHWTGEAS